MRVLFVCTGNVCRSPLAEYRLKQQLLLADVKISSAGVEANAGQPMTESALEMAQRLSIHDAEDHRSKQLMPADITRASLILGMDRNHRRRVAEIMPAASRRSFTVREFARIIEHIEHRNHEPSTSKSGLNSLDDALMAALKHRGMQPRPENEREHDVVDPYGRGFSIYERSTAQLVPAVDIIAKYFVATTEAR